MGRGGNHGLCSSYPEMCGSISLSFGPGTHVACCSVRLLRALVAFAGLSSQHLGAEWPPPGSPREVWTLRQACRESGSWWRHLLERKLLPSSCAREDRKAPPGTEEGPRGLREGPRGLREGPGGLREAPERQLPWTEEGRPVESRGQESRRWRAACTLPTHSGPGQCPIRLSSVPVPESESF